jgi:SAM-dependent methyltransferase
VRPVVREFVADAAEVLPINDPIVEIGARPAAGQEEVSDLRPLFGEHRYVGCDIQPGARVDFVTDVHGLALADGSLGTVVCTEVLEHVLDPIRAVEEIHRILRPGGVAILTSVMFMPIHEHPWDYWRFTPDGFAKLLAPFETSLVIPFGFDLLPEGVFGVGVKGPSPGLSRQRFSRTDASCNGWGMGMPVDLGPIRMTMPFLWRFTLEETRKAGTRQLRRAAHLARRRLRGATSPSRGRSDG